MHKIEWKDSRYGRVHEYTATVYGGCGVATVITTGENKFKYTILYKRNGSMGNSVIFASRTKYNKESVKAAAAIKVTRLLRVLEED